MVAAGSRPWHTLTLSSSVAASRSRTGALACGSECLPTAIPGRERRRGTGIHSAALKEPGPRSQRRITSSGSCREVQRRCVEERHAAPRRTSSTCTKRSSRGRYVEPFSSSVSWMWPSLLTAAVGRALTRWCDIELLEAKRGRPKDHRAVGKVCVAKRDGHYLRAEPEATPATSAGTCGG
eukprot:6643417-Prymnesium_polylepis.1